MVSPQKVIAVVDDDPDMLKAIGRLLAAHGFRSEAFASAEAFLNRNWAREPACLVLARLHLRTIAPDRFVGERSLAMTATWARFPRADAAGPALSADCRSVRTDCAGKHRKACQHRGTLPQRRSHAAHAVAGLPRNPRHDALPLSPAASIERGQAGSVVALRSGKRDGSRDAIWFPRTREILCAIQRSIWRKPVRHQATSANGALYEGAA